MKICLLPIDSRPCTSVLPQQLAAIRGIELISPPRSLLGYFKQPSQQKEVAKWLAKACVQCDAAVISIEQLLYGGLIASRQNIHSLEECLRALEQLRIIKKAHPNLKIFANNILMRTTISTVSEKSFKWWKQVSEFSRLKYEVAMSEDMQNSSVYSTELKKIQSQIPEAVLEQYLTARRRNRKINRACLELAHENIFEQLLILQEDCSKRGIQQLEQKELETAITNLKLEHKVFLHNGTDEAGMEQVLTAALSKRQMKIQVIWLYDNTNLMAKYEDRPFGQNLASHMRAMNITPQENAKDCLFILPPVDIQGDYCPKRICFKDFTPEQRSKMAEKIVTFVRQGYRCFLLDLAYANGGDPAFMQCLAQMMPLTKLSGYASWNTASNSLGTIIGQIAASRGENSVANQRFTAERILDDLIYQSTVRQEAERRILDAGLDMWGFTGTDTAQQIIDESFTKNRPLIVRLFGGRMPRFAATLYWPRTFELEIRVLEPLDKEIEEIL